MMKKLLLATLITSTFTLASDLYTDTYMSGSGVVYPHVSTGITNPYPGERLLKKKIVLSKNIYFDKNGLTEASQKALNEISSTFQQSGRRYYVSIIGHTASFTDEYHYTPLNDWSRFWQNIRTNTMSKGTLADSVNHRIQRVYDMLTKDNISPSKIYTENRMDRDPIVTEETDKGRAVNNRVAVTLYY